MKIKIIKLSTYKYLQYVTSNHITPTAVGPIHGPIIIIVIIINEIQLTTNSKLYLYCV